MEENVMYFELKPVGTTQYLRSAPEEDFGFDWEKHSDHVTLPNQFYADAGLVAIDQLLEVLQKLKSEGANYVSCDWHCDHGELEVTGAEFSVAPEEKVNALNQAKLEKEKRFKELEIKKLEEKLEKLKAAQ